MGMENRKQIVHGDLENNLALISKQIATVKKGQVSNEKLDMLKKAILACMVY